MTQVLRVGFLLFGLHFAPFVVIIRPIYRTGHDSHLVPDQSKPARDLIEELLASGTGGNGCLTKKDIARFSAKRRVEARRTNGQYSMSFSHKLFGSSK